MIFHPWVIGIITGDFIILFLVLLGTVNAGIINKSWDFEQTTPLQYKLEKKTYLISAIMNFTMGVQITLLLLFVIAADEISAVLPGAMCATGALAASNYGFPLLFLKLFFSYYLIYPIYLIYLI